MAGSALVRTASQVSRSFEASSTNAGAIVESSTNTRELLALTAMCMTGAALCKTEWV